MNERQEINKILHSHLDVDKHSDYTNYKELITAIQDWHKSKSQKSAIPIVSLSWLDSDLQKMAQKTREAYRDFEGDKETVAAQAFINGCYAAKRYFEKQLSHEG